MRCLLLMPILLTLVLPAKAAERPPRPRSFLPGPVAMLPKWRVPADVSVVPRADEFADYRAAHPEWYAVTLPPSGDAVSGAVEWGPMATMLLANPGGLPSSVQRTMVAMVHAAIDVIAFDIVVGSDAVRQSMLTALRNLGVSDAALAERVRFLSYPSDSIWMADFGPIPLVRDGTVAFADFRYYEDRVTDDAFPTRLGNHWKTTTYRAPLDLEGGNFATDGEGTCYVSQGLYWRNADKTADRIDALMREYLGCRQMVVLVPLEDGTTHIDMFFKPASKRVVILGRATVNEATERTIATLERNREILEAVVLEDGSRLTVLRIPMPYQKDGVWRTYTNATFANGVNLVPTYAAHAQHQAEAMAVWAQAMPDWTHVPIESGEVITWGGAMHCLTRTLPALPLAKWVPDGTCEDGRCTGVQGGFEGDCEGDIDCTGPGLVCGLNECEAGVGCGDISDTGCCDDVGVRYCEDDRLQILPCEDGCGWSGDGYYDCGGSGADPAGIHPLACPVVCRPDCAGRHCGDDGCGGSCGACFDGTVCAGNGRCVAGPIEPVPDVLEPPEDPGSGGAQDGWADAFPDAACVPGCAGGRCGDDGCGGMCPGCPVGQFCTESGYCVRELPRSDTAAPDLGEPLPPTEPGRPGAGGGGCVAGLRPGGDRPAIPWYLPWLMTPILFFVVYNTRRVREPRSCRRRRPGEDEE